MRIALAGLAFATAVRVIHRVHRQTAYGRTDALVAPGAGLAPDAQVVFEIADLADGGAAVGVHAAQLARAQTQGRVVAFARDQLHAGAGRARELRTLARTKFDAVNRRTDRHVAQRKNVARLDGRIGAGLKLVADRDAARRDDVAALAVGVAHQGDVGAAVRIVFDGLDLGRDAVLVALEINHAVSVLVPAA